MATTFAASFTVQENKTGIYTFTLQDVTGSAIDKVDLLRLTLTYYDILTEQIINTRQDQDALDMNDVTVFTEVPPGGMLPVTTVTWFLQPGDCAIVDDRHGVEHHAALFQWAWGTPEQRSAQQVGVSVENLLYVP